MTVTDLRKASTAAGGDTTASSTLRLDAGAASATRPSTKERSTKPTTFYDDDTREDLLDTADDAPETASERRFAGMPKTRGLKTAIAELRARRRRTRR